MRMTADTAKPHPRCFAAYLMVTAMVCGALVMVIEVLGSRVIGPLFGVSLFVWTSLITTTLLALALGYAAGGLLSDRRDSPDWLYAVILAAGLLVLAIPSLKAPVMKSCLALGLRSGSLASSLLLFGPSLFLLGMVSPYIVKIAARELENIGRTVGVFYAISTVGSFAGTLLTGFVLIAWFGVDRIFLVVGFLLIALGAGYFAFFRRKYLVMLLLPLPFLLLRGERPLAKTLPDGTKAVRQLNFDGYYGNLKVIDFLDQSTRVRNLYIDGFLQGGIDLDNGLSLYEYSYFMDFLPYGLNPDGKDCLVVGLGAGLVPTWYEKMGIRTDVVDINPEMPRVAREYFGYKPGGDVFVSDARFFLEETTRRYDYMILDVYTGDTTPGHLLSLEAFRLMKKRLTGKGILAINLVGSLGERTLMTASVIRTLKEVFATVETVPVFDREQPPGVGNLAVIAMDTPLPPFHDEVVSMSQVHPDIFPSVSQYLHARYDFPAGTPSILLTDDYNPIDVFDLWLKEFLRKIILDQTDWDLLI